MLKALSAFSGLSVDNAEKAKEFYVDKLGLKLTDESMGLQFELPGGGQLFVYEKSGHVPAEFTVLNFVVEDIDETVDHLVSDHGIEFERYDNMPGQQDEKGIMRGKAANMGPDIAWFKDPAGNILSVLAN
jgi:catechol 2,3-dioxygenase-like lactoylglutathione lyase family enzyme